MSELEMHHSEAVAWIRELEAFIVENGLSVPTWADRDKAGLQPETETIWVDYDDGHAGGYPHTCTRLTNRVVIGSERTP